MITKNKDRLYHAAMLDPHTAAGLSLDEIYELMDELIQAHNHWLPKWIYK